MVAVFLFSTIFHTHDLARIRIPIPCLPVDPRLFIWTVLICLVIRILAKMSLKKCCVPNCNSTRAENTILHLFPNPDKDSPRFLTWINAIGGDIVLMEPERVFKTRRVCHSHFELRYNTRSRRLSANAVPTLGLSVAVCGLLDTSDINMRSALPISEHDLSQNSSPGSLSHRVPVELSQTDWESSNTTLCSKNFLAEESLVKDAVPTNFGTNLDHNYYSGKSCYVKVCRICFVTDVEMHSMPFLKDLNEAYETITGVSTSDEEHLPRYLCTECADRLMNCARFRRRSLRAHVMLLDIVRKHGQVTVELIRSELQIHNPFSSDPADNPNEENFGFDNEDLEEINKQTDARTDTPLEEVDVYEEINNIKSKEDCEIDRSQVNSEDRTDDMIDMTENKVKTENDGVSNEEDFNASTSKSNENAEVDGVNNYDPISKDNRGVCSSNLDEDVDVIGIVTQNDVINRDDVSECSFSLKKDTKVDFVTIDNEDFIYQYIVNDEVISEKSLVYSSRLYEDTVRNIPEMKHSDVCNEVISVVEKLPNDYMEYRHTFLFVGEDVLNDPIPIQNVGQNAEKLMERDVNEVMIDKQQTPEADGPSTDDTLLCDICPYQTDSDIQLLEHLKEHATEKIQRRILTNMDNSCNVCKKSFAQEGYLQNHLIIHTNSKPFSCHVCKRAFKRKYILKNHLLLHSTEKSYSCDICRTAFRRKPQLQKHLKLHFDKKHSCDSCRITFNEERSLSRHLNVHSSDRPYSCHICKKAFKKNCNLTLHLKLHLKKPYSCDICRKMFIHKLQLQKHIKLHSDGKLYLCDICRKTFIDKRYLRRHLKLHYKVPVKSN